MSLWPAVPSVIHPLLHPGEPTSQLLYIRCSSNKGADVTIFFHHHGSKKLNGALKLVLTHDQDENDNTTQTAPVKNESPDAPR